MRQLFKQAAVVAAVFAAACSEQALEISVVPAATEQGFEKVFYATFDGETKTYLSMNDAGTHADVFWNAGDEIIVFGVQKDPVILYYSVFTTGDGGSSTASFAGSCDWDAMDTDEFRAFYPYDTDIWPISYGTNNGIITHPVTVPPFQHAVAGGLEKGLNMAVALNDNPYSDELHFKNILSLVRFKLSGSGVSKISKIRFSSKADLSGDGQFIVDNMSFRKGYYFPSLAKYGGSLDYVELEGPFVAGEDYYIAVKPCTLNGFKLRFFDDEGNTITKSSTKTIELQRSRISDFGTVSVEDTFGELPSGVERYMTQTKGSEPVCIAVVGDAFTAAEQDKFKTVAREAVDAMFETEPYKTYKDYFNVYLMSSVSNESGATVTDGNGNIVTPHDTYFSARWGANSYGDMTADFDRVFSFVSDRCPEIYDGGLAIEKVPVLIIVNEDRYGGRCTNWSTGSCVGIVPTVHRTSGDKLKWSFPDSVPANNESPDGEMRNLTQDERDAIAAPMYGTWLNIAVHEFGGHGIGRLYDEYWYDPKTVVGPISAHSWEVPLGLNVSSSYNDVPWQSEVIDVVNGSAGISVNPDNISYYSSRVGIFQGGNVCTHGRWRSEFVSCMIDNRFYFSLWQRMLIVKRIMSLSGETFDLQEFYNNDVPYDPARDSQAASAPAQIARKAVKGEIVHEVPMLLPPREIHN